MYKKLIQNILKTPLFTHNPLYKKLYWWNARRLIPKLITRPIRVIVENTNHCNLKCDYCGNPHMKRAKGTMSYRMFEDIVDQCAEWGVEHLYALGVGEPLMDKGYPWKLNHAFCKIPDVHCVTNGLLLNYTPRVHYLGVTVNDDTAKNLLKVFANVSRVYNNRIGKYPFIECRFKPDTAKYVKKFKPICDKTNVYLNVTNWGKVVKGTTPMGLRFPCSDLWTTLYICWDGRVALCCKDYERTVNLGNVERDSLKKIWNWSHQLEMKRKEHLRDSYEDICKDCLSNTHLVNPWWEVEL